MDEWKKWLLGAGLVIVIGTHIYMLAYGLPPEQYTGHAVLNLVAGGAILAAKMLNR